MARVPFNPKIGRIKTDAGNFAVDRSFLAHYNTKPAAASTTDVLPFTKLGAAVQNGVLPADAVPDVPRNVQVDANNSGVKKAVKIYGTNFAGEVIDETITTNETTAVAGTKAFASITKIDLPVQHNAGAKHKSTVAVSAVTGAGTAVLEFVSAATGTKYSINCVLAAGDVVSTTTAAAKIKAVLNADAKFAAAYTADSSTNNVTIERKINENSDTTVNLTVKAASVTGLVLGTIATDTTVGVCDEVSIGWGSSIGIPYKLAADELVIANLFNNADDNGTVTNDATYLEKNVFAVAGTLDGTAPLDLYIIV
jgi:hypothetical protein